MKRILFLDANVTLVESIKYARQQGYFTITCDNKKSNPGHLYSDKQYYISTYDIEGLSDIVENEKIDGIVYFSSLHGLYGACRLIEKYSLSGFPLKVEQTISDKYNFRVFLSQNNFYTPKCFAFTDVHDLSTASKMPLPLIVKPVDGGGNRGISKVESFDDLENAINYGLSESLSKKVVVEEYVKSDFQINGDCLYVDGKLIFAYLGRYLYPSFSSMLPFSTIFGPDVLPAELKKKVEFEIQRIITLNKLDSGVLNVEIRIGEHGEVVFIEINPRHSGNRIYMLMDQVINIPMEHIAVEMSIGSKDFVQQLKIHENKYLAFGLLFSEKEGILENLVINADLEKHIISKQIFKNQGDEIKPFTLLRERVGLLHLSFNSKDEMEYLLGNLQSYYRIELR